MSMQSTESLVTTTNTLANMVEFGQCVISKIAGGDISNHIDGEFVRPQDLSDLITAKIQSRLAKYLTEV